MKLLLLSLLLAAPASAADQDEVPFKPVRELASAAACLALLVDEVRAARAASAMAAEGPYEIAPGDLRMHRVDVAEQGHRITEQRCLGFALSMRSWVHAMPAKEGLDDESPYSFKRVFGG